MLTFVHQFQSLQSSFSQKYTCMQYIIFFRLTTIIICFNILVSAVIILNMKLKTFTWGEHIHCFITIVISPNLVLICNFKFLFCSF